MGYFKRSGRQRGQISQKPRAWRRLRLKEGLQNPFGHSAKPCAGTGRRGSGALLHRMGRKLSKYPLFNCARLA